MKIKASVFTLILVLVFFADESNATYSVWGLRRLIIETSNHDSPPQNIPPVPGPIPNAKEPEASLNDSAKSTTDKTKDLPVSNDPVKTDPKSSNKNDNKTSVAAGPPTELPAGNEKNNTKKENKDEKKDVNADSKSSNSGSCVGSTEPCRLLKNLTACIQSSESRSTGLVLLILNEGESTLKVNISMATSPTDEHLIPEKKSKKISIPSSVGQGSEILLKAGDEECTLHVGPVTVQSNFFQQLPSYYKQITPIYIAYFIFLVTLVVGVTCACCQLRKRKRQDGGVPYQELEMGISESASATNIETADGWDDGWDDDWDDDKAVKSPGHRVVGISANGLTARPSKQDGWGKDWDD